MRSRLICCRTWQFALDCAEGLQAIYDAIDACGSTEDAIEETAELLSSGGLSIVYHAGVSLVLHGVDIYHWVKDCYENFEEKNWLDAGRDIGDIIGVLV
ncbi:hypothetical protein J8273_3555 [Carpediemonas membranifera]|uniref:Uncharacterized protein n=1 Tax=Carpediemonas membranifera TaxID=201153 RepID=A0A8J6B5F7_9EUKA|nr:hypothetical protein J8273_3555 [Carpediemonas membranifera]|eukprot:KAG9393419.1 hypothetical protein J8273_3555 [Carpediemonas membranifera]